ncbi:ribose-5-phosphate isomerase RpiA [Tepidibacillus fermentans]|uniref:Ribose-5-phosphate isomerase A n=1 Tax=Tepidibacillus fermentans TaxID=1281767 RepID=A0A4R3KKG9_9BACI|nr:ribose-5-phosphate isomerase RpiA [Tepidibacillus fermentans]TCS84373.1 ribose-5-phosphate isomerase [Tepidibacillus fermentans]
MNAKQLVGEKAVDYIKDGMVVGLGTGSTVYWTIQKLGQLVKEGLSIKGIPTSVRTEELAKELGIPLTDFASVDRIDVTIDGADEIDSELNLIKGGGGALLREKIVAAASAQLIIVADESKLVKQLGQFPLPVEVIPFGWENTMKKIAEFGCQPRLRLVDDKPDITDNGNYILDCKFDKITKPEQLNKELNTIPGVVENGLFPNIANMFLIGKKDGKVNVITNMR